MLVRPSRIETTLRTWPDTAGSWVTSRTVTPSSVLAACSAANTSAAVVDRAGRLQLPREMTEPLGISGRVRLEAQPDHIGVWPDRPAGGQPDGAPGEDR